MKKLWLAAALSIASVAAFAADVGVSVSIGQPGFYGQIDIGGYPPPQVIYQQPRVIYGGALSRPPVYLRVPPGHAKNWRKYCGRYNACDERVYFVKDNWYQREYAPRYRARDNDGRHEQRNNQRGNGRNNNSHQEDGNHGRNR